MRRGAAPATAGPGRRERRGGLLLGSRIRGWRWSWRLRLPRALTAAACPAPRPRPPHLSAPLAVTALLRSGAGTPSLRLRRQRCRGRQNGRRDPQHDSLH